MHLVNFITHIITLPLIFYIISITHFIINNRLPMKNFDIGSDDFSKTLYQGPKAINAQNFVQTHFSSDEQDSILLSTIFTVLQQNSNMSLKDFKVKIISQKRK